MCEEERGRRGGGKGKKSEEIEMRRIGKGGEGRRTDETKLDGRGRMERRERHGEREGT